MSDSCLGHAKENALNNLSQSLPEWFKDVIDGRITEEEVIQTLVDAGL